MAITLTAAQIQTLTDLHGLETLKRSTNPEASAAGGIVQTVLATGVEAAVAAFERRGHSLGQGSIEVLFYAILWITPRTSWSPELKLMDEEWKASFPFRWGNASSAQSSSGEDVDSHKAFTQDNLDRLDKIRFRPGHDQPRGNA